MSMLFILLVCSGAIEPQFYASLIQKLGLANTELPNQLDREAWPEMKRIFQDVFAKKTQAEWTTIFDGSDACTTPVLSFQERIPNATNFNDADHWPRQAAAPQPAPVLSRTPAKPVNGNAENPFMEPGSHSVELLTQFNVDKEKIQKLLKQGALVDSSVTKSRL